MSVGRLLCSTVQNCVRKSYLPPAKAQQQLALLIVVIAPVNHHSLYTHVCTKQTCAFCRTFAVCCHHATMAMLMRDQDSSFDQMPSNNTLDSSNNNTSPGCCPRLLSLLGACAGCSSRSILLVLLQLGLALVQDRLQGLALPGLSHLGAHIAC